MPHCLVTGASRGIGRATAIALAADGWSLSLNYRTHAEEAEAVAAAVREAGAAAQTFCADVADPAQAAGMVKAAEAASGLGIKRDVNLVIE